MRLRDYVLGFIALCALAAPGFGQSSGNPQQSAPTLSASEIPTAPAAQAQAEILEAEYGHGILIEGDEAFVSEMVRVLDQFATYPTGQRILEMHAETSHGTVIREFDGVYAAVEALDDASWSDGFVTSEGELGPGTDALVLWNPGYQLEGFNDVIVMGHELIHALDLHRGMWSDEVRQEGANAGTLLDELRAIGAGEFQETVVNENLLRAEWNERNPTALVPLTRTGHGTADFLDDGTCNHSSCSHGVDPKRLSEGIQGVLERLQEQE